MTFLSLAFLSLAGLGFGIFGVLLGWIANARLDTIMEECRNAGREDRP